MEQETPALHLGYRMQAEAMDMLALRATLMGQEIDPEKAKQARHGMAQIFPLTATDLPNRIGPALGAALKSAEREWLDSGFTLTKVTLIARHNRG
jgi:poly(A) polymerase